MNETLKGVDEKHIEIITQDKNGNIIAKDIVNGDYGERFAT